MTTRMLIVGDSHIYAVKDALDLKPSTMKDRGIEALRVFAEKNGKTIGDISLDEAVNRVSQLAARDLAVTMLRGNQFNTMGLIQHPRAFDIMMPEIDGGAVLPGAELIPLAIMRKVFADTLAGGYGKNLLRFNTGICPCVCLAPPAPKEDADHIMKGAETYFRDHGIAEVGVSPAPLRLKLWTLQQEALANFCKDHGLVFMTNPPGTRDEAGFLKRQYYAPDATHANADYAVLLLEQLALLQDGQAAGEGQGNS